MPQEVFPVIVSASRATDLPAFHGEWFAKSLADGFCLWRNPFNGETVEVSFAKTRFFVFWSKNPEPFLRFLPLVDAKGLGYYFQFTLNDYEAEGLEPGVPPLARRLETFKRLSAKLGPARVVWRFDPIALSKELPAERILERMARLAKELDGSAEKLVVSFVDIAKYANARRNMTAYHEPDDAEIETLALGLSAIARERKLQVATCAENVNLELYGIEHNSCVDAELTARLAPDDAELREFLAGARKDKGQRKNCLCVKSKDIGQYGSCPHGCLYCYANRASPCAK